MQPVDYEYRNLEGAELIYFYIDIWVISMRNCAVWMGTCMKKGCMEG